MRTGTSNGGRSSGFGGFHNYWNNSYVIDTILRELGLRKECKK